MAKKGPKLTLRGRVTGWLNNLLTPPTEQAEYMTMPPSAKGDTAFRLSGILTAGILLLVLVFGAVLGMRVYCVLGMGSNYYKNIPIIYLQQDGTLKSSDPFVEAPVTIASDMAMGANASETLNSTVWQSENGKKLLYMDNLHSGKGELFYGDGTLIASDVRADSVNWSQDDKTAVYLRSDPANVQQSDLLCRWTTGEGENLLEQSCAKILDVKQSGEVVFLQKVSGGQSLNVLTLPKKKDKGYTVQIVDDKIVNTYSIDGGRLAYTKKDDSGGYSLYLWDGKETRLLSLDVDVVVDVGAGGEVFYLEETLGIFEPMKYFDDDMERQDRTMEEPLEENFMVEKKSLWGKVTKVLDKEAFEAAMEAYEAKLARDRIRSTIESRTGSYRTYSLHYNFGGTRQLVDADIMEVPTADAAAGTAVYYKERSSISERPIISKIADEQEAGRMVDTILNNTIRDYYSVRAATEPMVFQTISKTEEMVCELDGIRGLYFLKSDVGTDGTAYPLTSGGTLYYAPFEQDGLGLAKRVDNMVVKLDNRRFGGQRLYYKSSGEFMVDLYAVLDGKKSKLASGLSEDTEALLHGDYILGYRSYHVGRELGELVQVKDSMRSIATKVHDYSFRTDSYIYLLKDYDIAEGYGDLYLYTGGDKLQLIDRQVAAIVG